MKSALHIRTKVLSGSRIEVTSPDLKEGQEIDVFLVLQSSAATPRQNILDFLDALPEGPRSASSWLEVDQQFEAERAAWDR